ncbi:MAG: CBS domain-containing protein [Sphingomonadales bacterium]|nr:CBS domain-containing protein [Sphingomonadales bacterium]
MTVAQIIKDKGQNIVSVKEDDTIMVALKVMGKYGIGVVLVYSGSEMTGIMSERDVARGLPHYGKDLLDMPVSKIMTSNVITCDIFDKVESVMELMTAKKIRHLPVMQDGSLMAVISIGDVVKQKMAQTEAEAESLKAYIAS